MSQVSLLHEDCCDILWKVENLTFKAPVITTADDNFFFFFFQRKQILTFQADDSHEMSRLVFSEK